MIFLIVNDVNINLLRKIKYLTLDNFFVGIIKENYMKMIYQKHYVQIKNAI